MKVVFLEPLGVEKDLFVKRAYEMLEGKAEMVFYDDRLEDTKSLIERSKNIIENTYIIIEVIFFRFLMK